MPKTEFQYKSHNIVQAVLNQPWAIDSAKLDEIIAFLEFRAAGGELNEETVKAAFMREHAAGNEVFFTEDGDRIDVDGIRYLEAVGTMAPKMNLMMSFSGGVSTQMLAREINRADADDRIHTILVDLDSPGGTAVGTAEVSQALKGSKKRTVVIARNMMASAAFWFGAQADELFATPSTNVGSVGVYMVAQDITKAAEEAGIKFEVIRAGPLKAAGIPYEVLTSERRASIQSRIESHLQMFFNALADGRNTSVVNVEENFGQGTVFLAAEAADRGMIDGVALFEEVLERERSKNSARSSVSFNTVTRGPSMKVTEKIKAKLFLEGYTKSATAENDECSIVLGAIATGQGKSLDEMDESQILEMIRGKEGTTTVLETTGIDAKGGEYLTQVVEPVRFKQGAGEANARLRHLEIAQLGKTLRISADEILEASSSEMTLEEVRTKFKDLAAKGNDAVGVRPGDSSVDKIVQGQGAAMIEKVGLLKADLTAEDRSYAAEFRSFTLMDFARQTLRMSGDRLPDNRSAIAARFLRSGVEQHSFGDPRILAADAGTTNRTGDHPDALSNMMGRILDGPGPEVPNTYKLWCRRLPDLPDTRPSTLIEHGTFHVLDVIHEGHPHPDLALKTQVMAFIEPDRHGGKVGLTIEMVMNDDLGAFAQQIADLPRAAAKTVDDACRDLMVSDPVMFEDSKALFHADHKNVGSVAAISEASMSDHRTLHRKIASFDSDRSMGLPIKLVLAPSDSEQEALQVLSSEVSEADRKRPATDANINTHRGTPFVIDSQLDDDSLTAWYSFADLKGGNNRFAPIAYAYVSGMGGEQGQRTTWVDPDTGVRQAALDVWFGYAPHNFRGTVKNAGA